MKVYANISVLARGPAEVEHATVEVELTRRNLQPLLDKLDDPLSARTLSKTSEDGKVHLHVKAVEDDAHYADRAPGTIFMPSKDEYR